MPEDKEGFYHPIIDKSLCIGCGICDNICPILHLSQIKDNHLSYYGYATDTNIRSDSSSGGAFTYIANVVLDKGGVIYGAAFRYGNDLRLEHFSTKEIPFFELRKSKYIQSYVGNAYQRVKQDLENDKWVLFVGTPCQIAGLVSFMGNKQYDKLITVDFICHGVPPMKLFLQHLDYKRINKSKISKIDFRYRQIEHGGGNNHINISVNKEKTYNCPWQFDPYYYGFEKNLTLRKSCYSCYFCNGQNKYADMTIADFWEVKKVDPVMTAQDGISLLLLNNPKYNYIIDEIRDNGFYIQHIENEYSDYVYQKQRSKETNYDLNKRNEFFKVLTSKGYKKAVKLITKTPSFRERLSILKKTILNLLNK